MEKKYIVGDYIKVQRSGSNEVIEGFIKEIFFNLFGYIAILNTDIGDRLISTETDRLVV